MPETVTFDHYEVLVRDDGTLHELGRGAMGITYKAFDTNLRVPVALKVISAAYLESDLARQRFVREARSAARLRHRNVATVYHLGTEDTWFYAMEFIDGETLEALIKRQGPLPLLLALQVAAQVARALNAAQQHGLVHRDIKPANLMLVREDEELVVKVIDFGLAKASAASGDEDASTVSVGGFVGTPHFASPEQLEEKDIDVRSDIYSLGVTLWYMLAGQAPFAGSVAQVMSQQLSKPPPFEKLAHLPEPVAALLRKMLEKDPAWRQQTPVELRREIEAGIAQLGDQPAAMERSAGNEENFDTLLDDASHRAAESAWETRATIAGRYRITETRGETHAGHTFRAHDEQLRRDVRLLRFKPEAIAEAAEIEREVGKIAAVLHPNLLRIYSFETVHGASFLTMEWTDGFTLLELLRARHELSAADVLPILAQAAAGADAALGAGLERVDFSLHQVRFHFAAEFEKEKLLHSAVELWPPFVVKLNPLGIAHARSQSRTWTGAQTMAGAAPARRAEGDPHYVAALGAIVYETLGGTLPPGCAISAKTYTPLAALSEEGNAALRRALGRDAGFPSAESFHRALAGLDLPGARRRETRPARALPALVPAPGKKVPVKFFGGFFAAVAIGVAVYFFSKSQVDEGTGSLKPAPAKPIAAAPTPEPMEVVATPVPASRPLALATPVPLPKPAPPPMPARHELLKSGLANAERDEAAERWPEALGAYVQLATDYPEYETSRMHLELMLGRMVTMPKGLPPDTFAAMRTGLTAAARMDIAAAMTLLADSLRARDPEASFNWMSAAAARGSIDALTQTGLMLSNGFGCERDMPRAVACLRGAAEEGDPAAKVALGMCYLRGNGVGKDEAQAIALFKEAAVLGSLLAQDRLGDCYHRGLGVPKDFAQARRYFKQAADAGFPDSVCNLGVLIFNGDGVAPNPAEAVRLFQKAANAGHARGMFLLGDCLDRGVGIAANKLQAQIWLKKAAEAGDPTAAEWCRKHRVPVQENGGR